MKIVFIGGVEIGYTVLESIYMAGYEVDTIYTLPESAATTTSGYIDFTPLAEKHGSRLVRTNDINAAVHTDNLSALAPDLIIVCGWQRLISKQILDIPRLGAIGFHSSLLPKYRGRAPVNWAIILGEKETGITMFYLTPDADDGDIIAQKSFPILLNDDCRTVYKKSALAGSELVRKYLPKIALELAPRIHNPSSTFPHYPKRSPEDGLIDFKRSALDVYNFVRGLTRPYPGAFYYNENGQKIIVWKIGIIFNEDETNIDDIVIKTLDLDVKLLDYEVIVADQ